MIALLLLLAQAIYPDLSRLEYSSALVYEGDDIHIATPVLVYQGQSHTLAAPVCDAVTCSVGIPASVVDSVNGTVGQHYLSLALQNQHGQSTLVLTLNKVVIAAAPPPPPPQPPTEGCYYKTTGFDGLKPYGTRIDGLGSKNGKTVRDLISWGWTIYAAPQKNQHYAVCEP